MHTNRLAQEQSPYLRQHQHNPVDWFPWGNEAFERARQQNKPIFLSIGYSTCHWCHVMERESFEDQSTADILNEYFVSIKVDREERPDVDKIYMAFVQATAGQGGWPLNAFLTPQLKPFYGGTYFPPNARQGRPAFRQILQQIAHLWDQRQSDIEKSASDLHSKLETFSQGEPPSPHALSVEWLHQASRSFKTQFDPLHGGFGGAPKFPRPSLPLFLLSYHARFGDPDALQMVVHTCERMAAGGIHDQLGGGFARYAVDAGWLVPHFEKMLYDNAQLTQLYLEAFLASGKSHLADTAQNILRYVLNDLTHSEGGFYSAEDADSEGHEGKFYCWTLDEMKALLSPEEAAVAIRHFGITAGGNFVDHSHPEPLPNQNVLSVVDPKLSTTDRQLLTSAKAKLLSARSQRVRPHLDDKILTSWNGLMLGAFARAYAILGTPDYRTAAERNANFIRSQLWDSASGTLYHRWRNSQRDDVQLLNAYAFLLSGLIDLYEATLNHNHLEWALAIAHSMIRNFHDPDAGGFWQSPVNAPDLIMRCKEDYDGAEPSGNSVATISLLKLSAITGNQEFRQIAEQTLQWGAQRLEQLPQAVPHLLLALQFALHEPHRAVIAGDNSSHPFQTLLAACHQIHLPHKVVLGQAGPVDAFAKSLPASPGLAQAYVCADNTCKPPVSDPIALRQILTSDRSTGST